MAEQNRRQIKNYLLDPNFQLRYVMYFAASGVAVMGLLYSLITYRLNRILEAVLLLGGISPEGQSQMASLLFDVSLYTLIAFFANLVFAFCFGLWMSHRVAGPAMKIQRLIKELTGGNYAAQSGLRKNDDLQAVMADLNELAATLKKKHG